MGCDFSTTAGVNQYIDTDGVARCRTIAHQVATRVERTDRLKGLLSAWQTPWLPTWRSS